MRILMIGGTGFIGPYVAKQLCDKGHEVTVFHRGEHELCLAKEVRHFRSPLAAMPIREFPRELLDGSYQVVIHMIPMGEADAHAAMRAFAGRAERLIALSSGDVYRAYGRFTGLEPGPVEEGLLSEDSPLREVLYPYRANTKCTEDLNYFYEKILVEREVLSRVDLPGTVLRLPKVYGPGQNQNLETVYEYKNRPNWRWTHGYVENVAAAITLAALHPAARGRVYNVGEIYTPTVQERLEAMPPSTIQPFETGSYNFDQNIAYDTTRIRKELGFEETVSFAEGLRRTFAQGSTPTF